MPNGGKKKQNQNSPQEQPAPAAPKFPMALPQRDISVIDPIFWTSGQGPRTSVNWADFERTMKRIGAQVKQHKGKKVAFTIPGLGTAYLHNLPSQTEIHPLELKEVENNLEKAFHWTRESFVLASG